MNARRTRRDTPDSHDFPTRPYDLVKEFVIALVVVSLLTVVLAAVFSSPDEKAISLKAWAAAAPGDVVATATDELAGTTTSATYGPPYNSAADGQKLGFLPLQKWAGVQQPVDSANDLVVRPLETVTGDPRLTASLAAWHAAGPQQRITWATNYGDALAKAPGGEPSRVTAGNYGPTPLTAAGFLQLASTGGLEQVLSTETFYSGDQSRQLLLLNDGTYLKDQARSHSLGGDQWGMMNEAGNYPGQPWMWLYTFWYQVEPFKSSANADALVWALMMALTAGLALVPFIPGVRSVPEKIPVHRLVWKTYYRKYKL